MKTADSWRSTLSLQAPANFTFSPGPGKTPLRFTGKMVLERRWSAAKETPAGRADDFDKNERTSSSASRGLIEHDSAGDLTAPSSG